MARVIEGLAVAGLEGWGVRQGVGGAVCWGYSDGGCGDGGREAGGLPGLQVAQIGQVLSEDGGLKFLDEGRLVEAVIIHEKLGGAALDRDVAGVVETIDCLLLLLGLGGNDEPGGGTTRLCAAGIAQSARGNGGRVCTAEGVAGTGCQ